LTQGLLYIIAIDKKAPKGFLKKAKKMAENKVFTFIKEARGELKKVNWPTKPTKYSTS
jgi:preprotein translocase subunit SecE